MLQRSIKDLKKKILFPEVKNKAILFYSAPCFQRQNCKQRIINAYFTRIKKKKLFRVVIQNITKSSEAIILYVASVFPFQLIDTFIKLWSTLSEKSFFFSMLINSRFQAAYCDVSSLVDWNKLYYQLCKLCQGLNDFSSFQQKYSN